jgi:hypothetical protein
MAGSRANVNDFLLGRDNGEGQLITVRVATVPPLVRIIVLCLLPC